MRRLLFCLSLCLSLSSYGQVAFQELSFDEALKRSYQESKIIFLQFESDDCVQCNEVADKGLSDAALSKKVSGAFLPVKISADHRDRAEIMARYNLEKGFGTFFINHNGTLLHRFPRTTSRSVDYVEQLDMALNRAGEALKVDELEREFRNGNRSLGFLESLLLKKQSLGLSTASLLDEYVELLPADSLSSIYTLAFLARMIPIVDSKADKVMRKDQALFNKAWYTMSSAQRVSINRQIVYQSMEQAIAEKNEQKAFRVATFCGNTYGSNRKVAQMNFSKQLLRFYERSGDDKRYLQTAEPFYERYYLTISVDSIKGIDSAARAKMAAQSPMRDTTMPDGTKRRYTSFPYAPIVQHYAAELNNGAWNIYKRTTERYRLEAALKMSERALEFFESPEVLDTYAHVAYSLNDKAKAIQLEQRAIELRKQRGYPTKTQEVTLERMKKDLPLD